jgi:hypothetical protein
MHPFARAAQEQIRTDSTAVGCACHVRRPGKAHQTGRAGPHGAATRSQLTRSAAVAQYPRAACVCVLTSPCLTSIQRYSTVYCIVRTLTHDTVRHSSHPNANGGWFCGWCVMLAGSCSTCVDAAWCVTYCIVHTVQLQVEVLNERYSLLSRASLRSGLRVSLCVRLQKSMPK